MENVLNREDLLLAHYHAEEILELGSRASLDRSPKKNWVESAGELPGYVREIAREIEKTGKTLSQAIAIAISRIKKLAATSKDPKVKAKAIAALAAWERLKAKNRSKKKAKLSAVEVLLDEAIYVELSNVVKVDSILELAAVGGYYRVKDGKRQWVPPHTDSRGARQAVSRKSGGARGEQATTKVTVRKTVTGPQGTNWSAFLRKLTADALEDRLKNTTDKDQREAILAEIDRRAKVAAILEYLAES